MTNQKFALHVGLDTEQICQSNILLFSKSLQSRINLLKKFVYCYVVVVVILFVLLFSRVRLTNVVVVEKSGTNK